MFSTPKWVSARSLNIIAFIGQYITQALCIIYTNLQNGSNYDPNQNNDEPTEASANGKARYD
jgi:hypothetical protein